MRSRISSFCASNSTNLLFIGSSLLGFILWKCSQYASGAAGDDREGRHVAGYQRARADHRAFADLDAAHDYRSASDRGPAPYHRRFQFPVPLGLHRALIGCGAGMAIVDEDNAVAHEHLVFDYDA